ncbi:hypothetical protein N7448_010101 [Penicillium atrosanguineum]|uniref:Xylanolytic transcriptional activator regulatory domain-containing protein n=1 Tax=Penicillium atrosanguineum TaxID=1132637 RepID=A0A9W9PN23_9EURO|nr:Tripeptidyl-peptidase sed2 [Penicillium atrosanguineum]KAJ5118392.1 hypothetical protein N7526_010029 [Penicillium atrosanguineum]KAJ5119432.1 hypothetical protein N7448_010101 [Penicillium atrosanguineum]KAJ5296426.1 Tripeptidyl-peptidase sed2 [Penicillium atrosanguineum]KAJ5299197.1 hypothetical protein N7476_010754 [Penicillium atrosanguineum]
MKRPREYPASLAAEEKSNATKICLVVNAHYHFMPVHKKRKKASDEKIELLEKRIKAMEASAHSGSAPRAATEVSNTNLISPGLQTRNQDTSEVSSSIASGMPLAADPYAKIYHSVDKGDLEFQGYSADRTFIEGFKHGLGDWAYDSSHTRLSTVFSVPGLFDTSRKPPVDVILPPREVANKLVEAALDAQILFCVIHRPSFNNLINLIYSLDQTNYSIQEWRFLALFYAVLAYGSLFVDLCEDQEHDALSQASFYYEKSIRLQDIADCKDLVSLQAIVFKILFLLATTRVFTCYTYITAALSVALRMGLHRSFINHQDLISREIGKRVFWALWILANEVAALCGLPNLLSREEIDQESPIETNDSYIELGQIRQQPEGEVCLVAIANVYRRLHMIFQGIIKHIYSEKRFNVFQPGSTVCCSVSMDKLKGIEEEFHQWARGMPDLYALGNNIENSQLTAFTLCITYAQAQIYLYRPFLQHLMTCAGDPNLPENTNAKWLATICIQACENIIMLCDDMYRRGLLSGGNWLVSRALFNSTLTLFYVVLTFSDTLQTRSILRCLALGRKVADRIAKRSVPGHRWKVMMKVMIATLPSCARHIQERLLGLEHKIPDLALYQTELRVPDDTYTASLGKQTMNLLGSDSSAADKMKWLAPHLLETLGHDCPQRDGCRSPSLRIIPKPADNAREASIASSQFDNIDDFFLGSSGEPGVNHGSMGMPLEAGEMDFGNLDEFLDLQNWL